MIFTPEQRRVWERLVRYQLEMEMFIKFRDTALQECVDLAIPKSSLARVVKLSRHGINYRLVKRAQRLEEMSK
jgi:hypothetical protein